MCEICGRIYKCHPRCPNYIMPETKYYCSFCGDGIFEDDEYIENDNGEYRHFECFYGMRDLLNWLGYNVERIKGDDYEED